MDFELLIEAVRRAKKDPRDLPLRDGKPNVHFHYAVKIVRAAWIEWKSTGRFPDSYGDLMEIDARLRSDVMMYSRAMDWACAWDRVYGEVD